MIVYDAITTKIFDIPPYFFFFVVGGVFASSLFILLLLKFNHSIPQYTKIFFLSIPGLLIGAKFFGFLTGLFIALANKEMVTINTFKNTGIVFYGGLIGFLLSFILIGKVWNKKTNDGVIDIVAVCIPLFHFWARGGCFFAGCCYGLETESWFSILYTNHIDEVIITASRIPIQLVEVFMNVLIYLILMILLFKGKVRGHLLNVYLVMYASMRLLLEFFRGDVIRGVWNGISFSQVVSATILISVAVIVIKNKEKDKKYEGY